VPHKILSGPAHIGECIPLSCAYVHTERDTVGKFQRQLENQLEGARTDGTEAD